MICELWNFFWIKFYSLGIHMEEWSHSSSLACFVPALVPAAVEVEGMGWVTAPVQDTVWASPPRAVPTSSASSSPSDEDSSSL